MNTEQCSLTRYPSTSQFLLICYYMEVVHFHMKSMFASFKWYISTYQTLSVLLRYPSQLLLASGHKRVKMWQATVSTIIAICLSHIGLAWYRCSSPPTPTNIYTYYHCVLSLLTNMLKSESCLIHGIVQESLQLDSYYITALTLKAWTNDLCLSNLLSK